MTKLIIVTLIWAFSFSLIGVYLRGVDSVLLAFLRVLLALICFLPFTKFRNVNPALAIKISIIGAIQIGIMYIFYYKSFEYLKVYEVALFTIFTPFYVVIIYDILKMRFRPLYLASVFVAVFGAFVIKFGSIDSEFLRGFLMIQVANICFAFGQTWYKFVVEVGNLSEQREVFGYFFIGAFAVLVFAMIFYADSSKFAMNFRQIIIVLWLSIGASALGYYLWNSGASSVDSGVLAIMNNAVIPAAILVNFMFFGANVDWTRLTLGAFIMVISILLHKKIMKFYELKANN